jgi:alkaline phosphatase D
MPDPRSSLVELSGVRLDRRRFLAWTGALAGTALYSQVRGDLAVAAPPMPGYPFSLGVASGEPHAGGVTLWTRLAPEPFTKDGGISASSVQVQWQLATDEGFTNVVASGTVAALAELAHSVHVDVGGLQPGHVYYYRFIAGGQESPTGRTKTAPSGHVAELAFAFASCQAWEDGFYSAYRRMAEQDLDLVIHLGDYIYEGGVWSGGVRGVKLPGTLREECRTLDRYRLQHALYKTDPDLQEAHRIFPWAVTWDDHEVENDYAGIHPAYFNDNEGFLKRRAAAYQAYYEHLPLTMNAKPRGGEVLLYRRLRYGDIAEFNMLDTRQYRDDQPCGDGEQFRCDANFTATKLGAAQRQWLLDGLDASQARWNVLAQGTMMGELKHNAEGTYFWQDAWDGYPGERSRILQAIHDMGVPNPISIAGDWHSTFVHNLKADYEDENAPVVATEFVGTSISSNGDGLVYGPYYGPMIQFNENIEFFDGDRRGYVLCTLDHEVWRTELRMVERVSDPDADEYTFARFVVNDGQAGAVGECVPVDPPPLGRVDC